MAGLDKLIDWERVDQLLSAGSPGSEVASYFGMHADTFYRHVEQKYKIKISAYAAGLKQKGDALLREAQYDKAISGDNTLLIWLGKCRLKQRENDINTALPTNDELVEKDNKIMELEAIIANLQENNDNKSQTE